MTNKTIKVALFAASSVSIPVINQLLQSGHLAGVILSARQDPDAQQLSTQLQQAGIPFQVFQEDHPAAILPHIDSWQANTGLIYTYSHKLPEEITQAFHQGVYNLHASALPKYRGVMPLYWQIRNRETQSVLTMIQVNQGLDTGDIVFQQALPIEPLDTLNTLARTMAEQAPGFVHAFIDQLASDALQPEPQTGEPTQAPMPTQDDLQIDWQTMHSEEIAATARAGNPLFNGCLIQWQQSFIGLLQATPVEQPNYGVAPGTVLHVGAPEGLLVATCNGAIRLDIITVSEGVFSGLTFAERFKLDAGVQLH
jgi:methionyl-tRNA formyltransferase